MSETQPTRTTRTRTAERDGVSDDLLARIVEATDRRSASRPNPMALETFEQVEAFAERAARSLMVPKDYQAKPDNIIVAVMKGKELGMPPIQALESIAIVNGRSSLWGAMVEGLCYASGLVEDHEEHFEGVEGTDGFTAVCTVKRKGIASPKVGRFSQADAKRAGLFGQATHGKYPRRMMQWRAKHPAFTDAFPDVLRGIAMREIEAEDAVATPGWTMPVPEKGWFVGKPQATSDGWDNTWFNGVVQKLAGEPNAWKWLDLLIACLADAPTTRDVDEIGDLPVVQKVRESAPDEAKATIDQAFADARARLTPAPAERPNPSADAPAPEAKVSPPATSGAVAPLGLQPSVNIVPGAPIPAQDHRAPAVQVAPMPEDPSRAGAEPSGVVAFAAWLVDADGSEMPDEDGVIPNEPYADPVAFVSDWINARNTMPAVDVEAFDTINRAALDDAATASAGAAKLIAQAMGAHTMSIEEAALPTDEPALFKDLPIDPAVVFAPPAKATKADYDSYKDRLRSVFTAAATSDAFNHAREVNKGTWDKFPNSQRLACEGIAKARQDELSAAPATNGASNGLDRIATMLASDVHRVTAEAGLDAWLAIPTTVANLERLRTNDGASYYAQVWGTIGERYNALRPLSPLGLFGMLCATVRACQTQNEVTVELPPKIVADVVLMSADPALKMKLVAVANDHKTWLQGRGK